MVGLYDLPMKHLKDKEVMLDAVKYNGIVLESAHESLKKIER